MISFLFSPKGLAYCKPVSIPKADIYKEFTTLLAKVDGKPKDYAYMDNIYLYHDGKYYRIYFLRPTPYTEPSLTDYIDDTTRLYGSFIVTPQIETNDITAEDIDNLYSHIYISPSTGKPCLSHAVIENRRN